MTKAEKAIKAFTRRETFIDMGSNIVSVKENGSATLWIDGKLAGVTADDRLYIRKEFANMVEVAAEYNDEWVEIDIDEEIAAQEFDEYLKILAKEHASIGNEDACPSGMEREYNQGF